MEIKKLVLGPFQTNCYIVREQGHAVVIDPARRAEKIEPYLQGLMLDGIILTHGHFDHIGAVDDLVRQHPCPIYIHQDDVKMLKDCPQNSMAGYKETVQSEVVPVRDGICSVGLFQFDVIHTPGHTEGSCLWILGKDCFCGDVLFKGSIGRTDLYSASESKMHQSLKLIRQLDPELRIYSGHGEMTTLEEELATNYFLQ